MNGDVDTAKTATHVSLCAGYGGIDLGLKRAIGNLRTVAFCEIEAFACANLVAKMEAGFLDAAPVWTDLKTFPWSDFHGRVDILSGGYPCQPFSAAGKRLGKDDPRHLWPWIADGILAMQPGLCFFENVEGHVSLGLATVISDLEEMGYRATWGIFSAAEVGAPHQRKRVFILAYARGSRADALAAQLRSRYNPTDQSGDVAHEFVAGLEGLAGHVADRDQPGRVDAEAHGPACEGSILLEDASDGRRVGRPEGDAQTPEGRQTDPQSNASRQLQAGFEGPDCGAIWPSRPGEPQHEWEPPRTIPASESFLRRLGWMADADSIEGRSHTGGRHRDTEAGSTGEVMGHPALGQDNGRGPGDMGQAASAGQCGDDAADRAGESVGDATGSRRPRPEDAGADRGDARTGLWRKEPERAGAVGQIESALGRDPHEPPDGLDLPELSGLSHRELAEIHEWMERCDNRTDELRLLGNGVVPATAHRAFVTLLTSLQCNNEFKTK